MADTKLHELLAAEGTAKQQADKCRADLLTTFEKKRHLFGEKHITFHSVAEDAEVVVEDHSALQSTVRTELNWIKGIWSRALDLSYQVAGSNMEARADVVLDSGVTLLSNVPATALLEGEKRMSEAHALIMGIPTLDPAKGFVPDPDKGVNIYRARDDVKARTKKIQRPLILHPATKEHPAQVQAITEDVVIGHLRVQEWSGLITPAEKAEMLNRAEELRRAFKTARSRANACKAATATMATAVLGYVFDGAAKQA